MIDTSFDMKMEYCYLAWEYDALRDAWRAV